MNKIRYMKCRKCNNVEEVKLDVQQKEGDNFSYENTFFCKDCDRLTTVNTVNQALHCKHCRSSNMTKFFSDNKVKCSKCGQAGFDVLHGIR